MTWTARPNRLATGHQLLSFWTFGPQCQQLSKLFFGPFSYGFRSRYCAPAYVSSTVCRRFSGVSSSASPSQLAGECAGQDKPFKSAPPRFDVASEVLPATMMHVQRLDRLIPPGSDCVTGSKTQQTLVLKRERAQHLLSLVRVVLSFYPVFCGSCFRSLRCCFVKSGE